jgi:hypothetical protein
MVAHARSSSPSAHLASVVRAAGGRSELERRIEVASAEVRPFRDVSSPVEAYDLRLDGEVVGQVVRDESSLRGMPDKGDQWVLNQREADYSLAASSKEEAVRQARAIVAAHLAETGENPSGQGQVRVTRGSQKRTALFAAVALAVALLAYLVRTRFR